MAKLLYKLGNWAYKRPKRIILTELGGSVTLSPTEIGGTSEVISIIAAFFVLIFTLGSLIVAGLPIITAVIGLITGLLGIMAATSVVDMSQMSISLASMVGLAVLLNNC